MDKKPIGILGYWFATNYGGVSSYYSLYKKVESLGFAPFLIENPYAKTDREGYDTFPRKFFDSVNANLSDCYEVNELTKLNDLADTFILGSDQVFTTSSLRSFGDLFLMGFGENKRKIAVSSSCGGDNLNGAPELLGYAREKLIDFSAISVREYTAVDVMKDKFGIDTDRIIDPIFFTSKQDYEILGNINSEDADESYLFAYILDPTRDKKTAITALSEKLNLRVKVALDGRKFTHEKNLAAMDMPNETLPELDLREWLYYFKNASYVITDSFHGAAMSLILNKPFVVYTNHMRGYPRFVTLSQIFGIHSRLIENSKELNDEIINSNLDFEKINQIIESENTVAEKWLLDAINGPIDGLKVQNKIHTPQYIENLYQNPDYIKIRLLATLLRDYGVKHIVLSPGGRNVPLVRMFEYNDDVFTLHHVTDERSAGYYGLGIAAQLQEPVACICTSGTAASNYLPAVTEAYYTGVPLIMITADRRNVYLNHGEDQTIPQKNIYRDVVKKEITVPEGSGYHADYQTRRDISDCILEATHNGFGPVHINITIDNIAIGQNVPKQEWKLLPKIYPHILRVGPNDGDAEMMKWVNVLKNSKRILIVYGQNAKPSEKQLKNIELFASKFNCAIVTDLISNLDCLYSLRSHNVVANISQKDFNEQLTPDILISVGGKRLMNDPLTYKIRGGHGNIRHWHVSPDGKIKDFYFRLTSVIETSQDYFFEWFANHAGDILNDGVYYNKWMELLSNHPAPTPSRFDAHYIHSQFIPAVPSNSLLHLAVGQTFVETRKYSIDKSVDVFCNMGTNGIDGCTSTFMGQCAVAKDKLCFLLVGDLSFFYDMNGIWDKQPHDKVRILMVNNNGSGLLRGNKLKNITSSHGQSAQGWVESTAFDYISAHSKEEFDEKLSYFLSDESEKALFFEVFCD